MVLELFLWLLMGVSLLTGAIVQGIKKILEERGKTYHANVLAGVVAVVVSIVVFVCYILFTGQALTGQLIVWFIALIVFGWLCAMLGYDKVKQLILQFKG